MSLVLRNIKGSSLTFTEMDDNLTYLEGIVGTAGSGVYLPLAGGTMSGNIEMGTTTVLKSSNGGGQIDLDYGGNPGALLLSTDNGAWSDTAIYITTDYIELSAYGVAGRINGYCSEFLVDAGASIIQVKDDTTFLKRKANHELRLTTFGGDDVASLHVPNTGLGTVYLSTKGYTTDAEVKIYGNKITFGPTASFNIPALPTYADNTAALAGGLVAGDVYKTATGVMMIKY